MTLKVQPSFMRLGDESAFAVLARVLALRETGKRVINLGIGQPDFRTPEPIVEAGIRALRDGHHGYTPAPGIAPLREAIAADLGKRYGRSYDPERVVVVPGGKMTMYFAIQLFGGPGVEIICPDPGFPIYASMIAATGATMVPLPIREEADFAFRADDVCARMSERTGLVILNSPANPTGGVSARAEVEKFVRGMRAYPDVAVLSDEIYSEMCFTGAEHVSLSTFEELDDRVIVLDGFSKTYAMTGWRLGYAYWPQGLVDLVRKAATNSFSCVNASAQWAGIAALEGKGESEREMMRCFDKRRHLVFEKLNAIAPLSCVMPQGAFYAFPNIKGLGATSSTIAGRLLEEAGVALISGTDFGAMGEGYLRLSYAASEADLEEAMDSIESFVSRL